MTDLFHEFSLLFAVIDPIGSVPVFIAAAAFVPVERRRSVAIKSVMISAMILVFFIVLGQLFLEAVGVSLVSFQLAGAVVLFLFGLNMIFGNSKPEEISGLAEKSDLELAVYPIAIPTIAGPGSMLAVVMLTDNNTKPILEQLVTTATLLSVLLVVLILLLLATQIHRMIGNVGTTIISRVMGLVIAALAIETGLDALAIRFGI